LVKVAASPSPACASSGAAACPVVVDANAECGGRAGVGVAAGSGDTGYIYIGNPRFTSNSPTLTAVTPNGGTAVDLGPIAAPRSNGSPAPAYLLADATGALHFAVFEQDRSSSGIAWASQDATTWKLEPVDAHDGDFGVAVAGPAGAGAVVDLPHVRTRDPATGRWSTVDVAMATPTSLTASYTQSVAFDSTGQAVIAYWDVTPSVGSQLFVGRPNAVHAVATTNAAALFTFPVVQMAAPADAAGPIVVCNLDDGIHVFAQQSGGSYASPLVPGTARVVSTCPGCGCTKKAEGSTGFFAVAEAGGSAWLAWHHAHVDFDEHDQTFVGGDAQGCTPIVDSDRSTAEIVIAKVAPDGTTDIRFRFSVPPSNGGVSMAGLGSRLFVVAETEQASVFRLRYVELDVTKL
jgi:hypothetical protein